MPGVRLWIPALSMMLASFISYVDRQTLAVLSPQILADCGLTAEQYGWVISAFSIAYMGGNPLWGRWLDRYGIRWGMIGAVSIWTAASMAHAGLTSFAGFAAARFVLGFGEGATFPGGLRTVVKTLPAGLRARGTALAYSGGSLGAVFTPMLVIPVYFWQGWRATFLLTGVLGVCWIALWWRVAPLETGTRQTLALVGQPVSFRDPRLWSFVATYAMGGLPLAFVLYHAALYLHRGMGKSMTEIGQAMVVAPLGWEAGYFTYAWLVDRFRLEAGDGLAVYRRMTVLSAVLVLPLAAVPATRNFAGVMGILFLAMFAAGGNVITAVGYGTRIFGAERAGLVAGLGAGSWSGLVAVAMPLFGRLFDQTRYAEAFWLGTASPLAGYALWLWVNRSRRQADDAFA
jgi:ACS family hexuronate transporter-like MFS transporter